MFRSPLWKGPRERTAFTPSSSPFFSPARLRLEIDFSPSCEPCWLTRLQNRCLFLKSSVLEYIALIFLMLPAGRASIFFSLPSFGARSVAFTGSSAGPHRIRPDYRKKRLHFPLSYFLSTYRAFFFFSSTQLILCTPLPLFCCRIDHLEENLRSILLFALSFIFSFIVTLGGSYSQ